MDYLQGLARLPVHFAQSALKNDIIKKPLATVVIATPMSLIYTVTRHSYLPSMAITATASVVAILTNKIFNRLRIMQNSTPQNKLLVVSLISTSVVVGGAFLVFPQIGMIASANAVSVLGLRISPTVIALWSFTHVSLASNYFTQMFVR
jgi:hypothetical protein